MVFGYLLEWRSEIPTIEQTETDLVVHEELIDDQRKHVSI